MEQPLVSIITVVYNGREFLEATILSVLKQRPFSFEYLVIDGGSTDGTLDIIREYEAEIDYFVSEKDKGIYDAMNKAIGKAKGKYLLFLNAQDELNISLDELSGYFRKDFSLIYGKAYYVDQTGNRRLIGQKITDPAIFFDSMPTCHQAIFYNKKYIPSYDLNYKIIADRIITYEILVGNKAAQAQFIDAPICTYYSGGFSDKHNLLFIREKFNFRKSHRQINLKVRIIHLLNFYLRYRFKIFSRLNHFKGFREIIHFVKQK